MKKQLWSLFCILSVIGQVQAEWLDNFVGTKTNEFKCEQGGFAVRVPCTLKETSETMDTVGGKTVCHQFEGERGVYQYAVSYSDYQQSFINQYDSDTLLLGASAGALNASKGRILSVSNVTLVKYLENSKKIISYPGKEVSISGKRQEKAFVVRARFYLVGNRLYSVMIVSPQGKEDSVMMADFLESFRLL